MENLNKTPTTGKFGDVAKVLDTNFGLIVTKLMELSEASKAKEMNCGFYSSETELKTAYPNPDKGMMAYVGSGTDYTVQQCYKKYRYRRGNRIICTGTGRAGGYYR